MRSRISGGSDEIVVLLLMVDLSDVSEEVLRRRPAQCDSVAGLQLVVLARLVPVYSSLDTSSSRDEKNVGDLPVGDIVFLFQYSRSSLIC
jgi:hypothetical protein